MKDLKHLIYFENLLQEANNELVQKAVADGDRALGYNCYYIPEVLLNLPGSFSSRLRAPNCTSPDVATYYMTNRNCPYVRSILERAIEGGYNYLNALFGVEACSTMERMEEHFELLHPVENKPFVTHIIDAPIKGDETNLKYYKGELQEIVKCLNELGIDTSDAAMRKAIDDHNEIAAIMQEISDMRKADNPVITGYEFHVIQLVSQVCPHKYIKPYLHETLKSCAAASRRRNSPSASASSCTVPKWTIPSSPNSLSPAVPWSLPTATASACSPAARPSRSRPVSPHLTPLHVIIWRPTCAHASWIP